MSRNPIKSLDKKTTVEAVFANRDPLVDYFTPGWDKRPGNEQSMGRAVERAKMGRKMTPLLGGKLIPKR